MEEGIVPGGGIALLKSTDALKGLKLDGDMQYGINILIKSLEAPLKQITANAGYEASAIIEKVRAHKNANYGFDALSETYTDMLEAGIIDPTKVVRTALQNASSVAGLLLTTEGLVADSPEDDKAPAMPPGGMGGMGGMY